MPRHNLHQRPKPLLPALRMRIPLVLILLRQGFNKRQIPGPQRSKRSPRRIQRIRVIHLRPGILLKRLNQHVVLAIHLPQPPAPRNLAIGQVRNNLAHAPLPRRWPSLNLRRTQPIQNHPQPHRRLRNHLRRIAPTQHPRIRNSTHRRTSFYVAIIIPDTHAVQPNLLPPSAF